VLEVPYQGDLVVMSMVSNLDLECSNLEVVAFSVVQMEALELVATKGWPMVMEIGDNIQRLG
jgi:hypothetical protein